jgi:hypothetical protein
MHGLVIAIPTGFATFETAVREAVQNSINYPLTQLSRMDGSLCQSSKTPDLTARETSYPRAPPLALSSTYIYACTSRSFVGLNHWECYTAWIQGITKLQHERCPILSDIILVMTHFLAAGIGYAYVSYRVRHDIMINTCGGWLARSVEHVQQAPTFRTLIRRLGRHHDA